MRIGVLVVSSSHLTKETLRALNSARFSVHIFKSQDCYLMQLNKTGPNDAAEPPDLLQITEYAKKQKCDWVSINEEAPLNRALPTYH